MSKVSKVIKVSLNAGKFQLATSRGSRRGMFAAMDAYGAVTKAQVPLRDGPLRDSGNSSVSADGKTGCYSYDTPYAVVQHENMQFQHQHGRKAKYMEDPLNDMLVQKIMLALLQRDIKKEL